MNTISGDKVGKASKAALEAGEGLLRLAPTWVPRSFLQPGRRLKLHPEDYYALGKHRGGIDERWFASTTVADVGARVGATVNLTAVSSAGRFGHTATSRLAAGTIPSGTTSVPTSRASPHSR